MSLDKVYKDRLTLKQGDFGQDDFGGGYDLIVSGLATHHLMLFSVGESRNFGGKDASIGPVLHIEDLFYPFVYSLIVVFAVSFVGVITSLILLKRNKRFLFGIIVLLSDIIIPLAYLTWFSNGVGGM